VAYDLFMNQDLPVLSADVLKTMEGREAFEKHFQEKIIKDYP